MGYLADINEIVRKSVGIAIPQDRLPKESFAKKSLEGTFYFSGLFSEGIPIEIASTLSRLLERTDASFVQTVISMNSTVDISADRNASSYMKKLHSNILSFESTEDIMDFENEPFLEAVISGKHSFTSSTSGKHAVLFEEALEHSKIINATFKNGLTPRLSDININPVYTIESENGDIDPEWVMNKYMDDKEDTRHNAAMDMQRKSNMASKEANIPKLLNERDAKKLNDYAPYNMSVRLMGVNDKNEFVQYLDFVVGIKTTVHVLPSDELITNLVRVIEDNGFIFNCIKWTTGEKEFFKDLVLNVSDIKLDIANKSAGSSAWWLTLKRMKSVAAKQKAMFAKKQYIPNATLVVTSLEVDYITKNHGYDLNNEKIAKKVMDGLFLMTFIIVDDATKTVKVLYDGYPTYQMFSLDLLEKEVSVNGNKLGRELSRMISRT